MASNTGQKHKHTVKVEGVAQKWHDNEEGAGRSDTNARAHERFKWMGGKVEGRDDAVRQKHDAQHAEDEEHEREHHSIQKVDRGCLVASCIRHTQQRRGQPRRERT